MNSVRKKEFLGITFLVWAALIIVVIFTRHAVYIPGISLGVLTGMLNLSSLMSTIDKKEEAKAAGRKFSTRMTWLFFARYLLVALIFSILAGIPDQLTGFLIGFLSLYAIFFVSYVTRIKAGK